MTVDSSQELSAITFYYFGNQLNGACTCIDIAVDYTLINDCSKLLPTLLTTTGQENFVILDIFKQNHFHD